MKNIKILFLTLSFFLNCFAVQAFETLLTPEKEPKIYVNNRILAKVQGNTITTYDLMKKMDLTFYRKYPEYASSLEARHQFYMMAWKNYLEEFIERELILADAKEAKVQVSGGDVRQEMETNFGPNIIENLDKVNMSFDEAAKIIEGEMIMERMISGRVHNKVLAQVTPIKIRQAYEAYIQDPANHKSTEWTYLAVTFKEPKQDQTQAIAQEAYTLLQKGTSIAQLLSKLKDRNIPSAKGSVTISSPLKSLEQDLSTTYKEILEPLSAGKFSAPFPHKSRGKRGTVYKILYVEEKIPGGVPTYKELESSLKGKLLNEALEKETVEYIKKLQNHYHVSPQDFEKELPADYEPFSLKN